MLILSISLKTVLKWNISENSCNPEKEKDEIKRNKLWYNIMLYGGIVGVVVGIVGMFLLE